MQRRTKLDKLKVLATGLGINYDERTDEGELSDKIVSRLTIEISPKVIDKYKFMKYTSCIEEEVENLLISHGVELSHYYCRLKDYNNKFLKIKEEYAVALENFNCERKRLREDFLNCLFFSLGE